MMITGRLQKLPRKVGNVCAEWLHCAETIQPIMLKLSIMLLSSAQPITLKITLQKLRLCLRTVY